MVRGQMQKAQTTFLREISVLVLMEIACQTKTAIPLVFSQKSLSLSIKSVPSKLFLV